MDTKLEVLIARANELNNQLAGYRRRTLELSRELGDTLLAMKAIVGHGNWKAYRRDSFAGSSGTAEACQRIAKYWDDARFVAKRKAEPDLCYLAACQFLRKEFRKTPDTTAQALLSALESLQAGLTRRDEIEQSSCFAFRDGMVFTFNDHVACRRKSPLKFNGAVPAWPLLNTLRLMRDEDVDMELTGGLLLVLGERKFAKIRTQPVIELPLYKIETPGEWLPLPENFSEAIEVVAPCTSKDMSQYLAPCIHIHPNHIEACDNSQAIRYPLQLPISEPFLVLGSSIEPVASLGMTEMSVGDKWVHFRNRAGLVYSCKRDSQPYESLDGLLRGMEGEPLTLPKGIVEAALRAEVFSSENADANEIAVEIRDRVLTLTGVGISGWYSQTLSLSTAIQNPAKFQVGPKMLAEFAKHHADAEVRITSRLLSVTTERFSYVVALGELKSAAPVRIRRRKEKLKYAEPWRYSVTPEPLLSSCSPGA